MNLSTLLLDKKEVLCYKGITVLEELRCQRCGRLLGKHFHGAVEIKCSRCGTQHRFELATD